MKYVLSIVLNTKVKKRNHDLKSKTGINRVGRYLFLQSFCNCMCKLIEVAAPKSIFMQSDLEMRGLSIK